MKRKLTVTLSGLMLLMCSDIIYSQLPGSTQESLDPTLVPQFVDPLPHFAGLRVKTKSTGKLIVKAVPCEQIAVSTGTVLDDGIVGTDPGVGLANFWAYSVSKDKGLTWTPPHWPAFTIEADRFSPYNIEYRNELYGQKYSDVGLTVDQSIMWAAPTVSGDILTDPYDGDVPIVVHLHGGEVDPKSDGGPDNWFTPGYAIKGPAWTKDNVDQFAFYPNSQEAATIWYHDHPMGATRLNVYAGLAGFYLIRGSDEEIDKLPGWKGDDLVKEIAPAGASGVFNPKPYLPEIEIAIQDRMFDTKGHLFWPVNPTNPELNPFWTPEFFGDIITVNGKTWPYLSVAPRKYRFRFLDGSNARFYKMWLENLDKGKKGPAIVQIGTDGALLDAPVSLDPLTGGRLFMAPGERADVVIDFSKVAPGTVLTLMNDAPGPYPTGDSVTVGTTDRILQFVVNGKMVNASNTNLKGSDKSNVPAKLRATPLVKLTNFNGKTNVTPVKKRQLTLNEITGDGGPKLICVNNSRFCNMPGMKEMGQFGDLTEYPVEGTTEVWQIINLTMDAHPMHMHLVQFQLVNRQNFDAMGYMDKYMNSFSGVNGGDPNMGYMYMGGEGPPFLYDKPNADGAVGGNPAISPFLTGPVIPADPNEKGWKDVIKAYPNQIMTYIVRFAPTELPLNTDKKKLLFAFNPGVGPGYVWHCHIVDHEDNEMMRPYMVKPSPYRSNKSASIATIDDVINPVVEGYALGQNFPNPFLDETEINFTLPQDTHVQLILYNQLGQVIKVLIDAVAPAGNNFVKLNAKGLASGYYFYKLNAGAFTDTKKLIIMK